MRVLQNRNQLLPSRLTVSIAVRHSKFIDSDTCAYFKCLTLSSCSSFPQMATGWSSIVDKTNVTSQKININVVCRLVFI